MGQAVERSPHLQWGQCGAGSLTSASPNLPPRPDCMSPALPHRGVSSAASSTPRPSPTPQGLPGLVGRTHLLPPAAAVSQLLLTCLKSQREGWHHSGTSALRVGAESGGSSRTVTPLTPALSGGTVRPEAGGVSQEAMSSRMHPCPFRAPPPPRGGLLRRPRPWAGRQSWTCTPSPYHQRSAPPRPRLLAAMETRREEALHRDRGVCGAVSRAASSGEDPTAASEAPHRLPKQGRNRGPGRLRADPPRPQFSLDLYAE